MSRKSLLVVIISFSLLLVSGCVNDNVSQPKPYSYENKTFDKHDWNTFELDSPMRLDGVLDESVWNDSNAFSFSSNSNNLSLKSYFGDKGVYFGINITDSKIFVNDNRLFWKNDSVELYFNPLNETSGPNSSFAQFRVDATGNVETWIGVPSPDGYPWSKFYIPCNVETNIDGTLNPADNESSNGYVIELFIPWEGLLLDSKPEKLSLMPAFVESNGLGDNDYTWNAPSGMTHSSVGSYINFGSSGYIERKEGTTFGNYSNEIKYTSGFDVTDDSNSKMSQTGAGDQYIYFKNINSTQYMYSVDIKLGQVLNDDQWPKAGVIVGDNGSNIVNFFFDPLHDLQQKTGVFTTGNSVGERGWQWGAGIGLLNDINYETGVKVSVIRNEDEFYILINDKLLTKEENLISGNSTPGLFTMNLTAEYTNYYITENISEIQEKIASITRYQGTVFGDSLFGKLYTQGFDFSNEESNVTQTGQGDQWIYFKDICSTHYMFSVDVELGNRLNNDQWPKVGVIAGENDNKILTFLLDPLPNKDNYYGVFVPRESGGNWQWGPGSPLPYGLNYQTKINVKVIRNEGNFYVLINDIVVDYRYIDEFAASQPGLFTMNHEATYSNYTVTEESSIIDSAVVNAEKQFMDNSLFENAPSFQGSVGFDLSDVNNLVTQNLGQDKVTYFKDILSSQYMFTTKIQVLGSLNNDNYPKVGVVIGDDGNKIVNFFLDPLKGLTQKAGIVVSGNSTGDRNWQWPTSPISLSNDIDYSNGIEVTVIRNLDDYYVLVEGNLIYQGNNLLNGYSKIGFFTMNMAAIYSNYSVSQDINEIQDTIDLATGVSTDSILGNSANGRLSSIGFDLSNQDNGTVNQTGGGDQFTYFTNILSTKYMIQASFLMGDPINDPFSKIGLLAAENSTGRIVYLADTRIEKFFKDVMAVYQPSGQGWDWGGNTISYNGGINYDEYVKLTVIRDGENFYYFVNDTYMYTKVIPGYLEPSVAGLFTMGQNATFKDFSATTDTQVIDQKLNKILINDSENGWSGQGDITINGQDNISLDSGSANVREGEKFIYKDGVTLDGNFYIEYKVSNINVSSTIPDWMWPKLSLLLINNQGNRNYISIGSSSKQMRFETMVDDIWKNGIGFPEGTNLSDEHTIRVERVITDDTATINIYFDGILQTFDGLSRTSNYLGHYTFGFTGDYVSGDISNIIYGSLN